MKTSDFKLLSITKSIAALSVLTFGCNTQQSEEQNKVNQIEVDSVKQPNVIVIFSDELNSNYLGCYGSDRLTPNIDQLAADGMRFTQAHCISSMSTPSRYTLLTGQYTGYCKHPDFLNDNPVDKPYSVAWNAGINSNTQTIAREMSKNGYFTGFIGKWHIGGDINKLGVPQLAKDADPTDPVVEEKLVTYQQKLIDAIKKDAGFDYADRVLWYNWDNFPVKKLQSHHFEWMTNGAVQFLDSAAKNKKPFFLYVATTAIHGPNHVESLNDDPTITPTGKVDHPYPEHPSREEVIKRLEDAGKEITHINVGLSLVDDHVHAIVKKVEDLNIANNTLIIFAADHNVEPGKASSYQQGVKTPMIVKWKNRISPGSINENLISYTDIFPTILDACQIQADDNLNLSGQSFWQSLIGESFTAQEYLYFENGYTRAIRDKRFKYIAFRYPPQVIEQLKNNEYDKAPNHLTTPDQGHATITMTYYPNYFDADQLYDLENDPYERNNLAYNPEYSKELKRLQSQLQKQLNKFEHPYNLGDTTYLRSAEFKALCEKARKNAKFPDWWTRDWKDFSWPPENIN